MFDHFYLHRQILGHPLLLPPPGSHTGALLRIGGLHGRWGRNHGTMAGCHRHHHHDYHHQQQAVLLASTLATWRPSRQIWKLSSPQSYRLFQGFILTPVDVVLLRTNYGIILPQPGSWTGSTIAASRQQTKAVFSGITSSHVTNEQWFLENIFYNFLFFKAHLQLCPFFEDRRTLQGDCAQRLNLGQANLLVGISVYFSTFLKITHIL